MERESKLMAAEKALKQIFELPISHLKNGDIRISPKEINHRQLFDLGNVDAELHIKRSGPGLSITAHV